MTKHVKAKQLPDVYKYANHENTNVLKVTNHILSSLVVLKYIF